MPGNREYGLAPPTRSEQKAGRCAGRERADLPRGRRAFVVKMFYSLRRRNGYTITFRPCCCLRPCKLCFSASRFRGNPMALRPSPRFGQRYRRWFFPHDDLAAIKEAGATTGAIPSPPASRRRGPQPHRLLCHRPVPRNRARSFANHRGSRTPSLAPARPRLQRRLATEGEPLQIAANCARRRRVAIPLSSCTIRSDRLRTSGHNRKGRRDPDRGPCIRARRLLLGGRQY